MTLVQEEILLRIERKVNSKLSMKQGYRKKAKVILERSCRNMMRRLFSPRIMIKQYDGRSAFGCDDLGRDIESGIRTYITLLENRGVHINTVIVLGSRAKGKWKPQSDVDLTIVGDGLPREGKNTISSRLFDVRKHLLLSDSPIYMGIEPSGCCSKTDFMEKLESFDLQALDAVIYGRVIYDDGFWHGVQAKYAEIEKKYGLEQAALRKLLADV